MPNRSQTSRSSQLAAGQTPLTVATCASSPCSRTFSRSRAPMFERDEQVDELEARLARPEVDGGQLGEQSEAQIRPIAQRARHRRQIVARHVDRRLQIDGRRRFELRRRAPPPAARRRARWHRQSIYASFCCAIFRWSWTMP